MRKLVAVLAVTASFFVLGIGAAEARHHMHHHVHSTHGGAIVKGPTAPVKVPSGISYVVSTAQSLFQGLFDEFKALGYAIGEIGCESSGHMHNSKHHWGGACDAFNQVDRDICLWHGNRVRCSVIVPAEVQIRVAHEHGLRSGCEWRDRDCGHFEVPGTNTPTRNKAYLAAISGRSYHLAADTSVARITLAQQAGVDDIALVMRETDNGTRINVGRNVSRHRSSEALSHRRGSRVAHSDGRSRSRLVRLETEGGYPGTSGNYLATASKGSSKVQRAQRQATTHQVLSRLEQGQGRNSQEHAN